MPKHASPKSLLDLCFDNVTRPSFMQLWCRPTDNQNVLETNAAKKRKLEVIVNPLEEVRK